ncbi:MAG: hypothetical protein NTY88_01410 [Bacteroidetes bacterium]|nr:hypothetical protein [Bacteroidota bacterium]
MRTVLLILSSFIFFQNISAQTDSASIKKPARVSTHYDSLSMARLNNSGNLMIAGGVGLFGVSGYLFYQGAKVYGYVYKKSTDKDGDLQRNNKIGTIYYACGGIAVAVGAVLIGLGARNKVEFKMRKRMLEVQSGFLDDGKLGLALNF